MEPKKFAKTHLQTQNEVKDFFKKLLSLNLLVEVVEEVKSNQEER
jgi:hypothetical protein